MTATARHTPGPWEYDAEDDYHNGPDGAYVEISLSAPADSPTRYARVDKGPTVKADAQLIAASPDLLAACKVMRRWLLREGGWSDALEETGVNAAIEKAEPNGEGS